MSLLLRIVFFFFLSRYFLNTYLVLCRLGLWACGEEWRKGYRHEQCPPLLHGGRSQVINPQRRPQEQGMSIESGKDKSTLYLCFASLLLHHCWVSQLQFLISLARAVSILSLPFHILTPPSLGTWVVGMGRKRGQTTRWREMTALITSKWVPAQC